MANKRGRSTSNDFDESENNEFQPDYETKSYRPKRAALRVDNDETEVPNIMEMSDQDRIKYVSMNKVDAFNYPQHYKDLIKREMSRRDLQGFENLKNITHEKVFQRTSEQYGRLTRIQNLRNVNCIKSRNLSEIDMDMFEYTDKAIKMLNEYGVDVPPTLDEYINKNYKPEKLDMGGMGGPNMNSHIFPNSPTSPTSPIIPGMPPPMNIPLPPMNMPPNLSNMGGMFSDINSPTLDNYNNNNNNNLGISQNNQEILHRNNEKLYNIEYEYEEKYKINRYQMILNILKLAFGDLSQYVCVAGGFALSMYVSQNYGYQLGFEDIDLFIHSCDQATANEILKRLKNVSTHDIIKNDNAFTILMDNDDYNDDDDSLITQKYEDYKNITIQIIKRLYTCPQQVITGFDVDSCCILTTLEGQIYTTERGYNAIERGYNVINFDRSSPSYMYRLIKYNKRGFGIWIPFMSQFKDNAVFDINILDTDRGSSILIKSLLNPHRKYFKSDYNRMSIKMYDYDSDDGIININKSKFDDFGNIYNGKFVEFQTLDVTEQTINTFNRQFIDDPKSWYPEKHYLLQDHMPDIKNVGHELVEINKVETLTIYARNIKRMRHIISEGKETFKIISNGQFENKYEHEPSNIFNDSTEHFLKFIEYLIPDIIVCGQLIKSIMTNTYNKGKTYFYSNMLIDENSQNRFKYELTKYRLLISIYNSILLNEYNEDVRKITNMNELGSIVFKSFDGTLATNEEENFDKFLECKDKFRLKKGHREIEYSNFEFIPNITNLNLSYLNTKLNNTEKKYRKNKYNDETINYINFMNSDVEFSKELDNIDEEQNRGFCYQQGKFFGQNYEHQRSIYNINEIGTEILDYPVIDNYVPS